MKSRVVSYRGIKEIDLGQIAKLYGGKGHPRAASSPLPKEICKIIIERIYKVE